MRKCFTLLMTVIMSISLCLSAFPVNAADKTASAAAETGSGTAAEGRSAEADERAAEATTAKSAGAQPDKTYENMASEDNPIGDNGSYYKLDGISDSPDITAESAVVMDATTGYVLYSKQGDIKRYPASITKVMTALLAVETCDMDEMVSYTTEILNTVEAGSSSAGITAGAELTMEQSLYALMLASANEAGAAIACHIAGSDAKFAKKMTKRAKQLGCKNTVFKNPHGLPNEEHVTTAYDMALIMKKAMEYKQFRTICGTVSYTIESDTLSAPIELYNHARILQSNSEYYYKYARGAKTGFTRAALNTLISYSKKDKTKLICVILKDYGADRSYIDSKNLYKWAFEKVKTIRPLSGFNLEDYIKEHPDDVDKEIQKGIRNLDYDFYANYPILVKKKFDADKLEVKFESNLNKEEGKLGNVCVYDGETLVGRAPVTYEPKSPTGMTFNNSDRDDEMKAANVNKGKMTPRKFLILLCIIAGILFLLFLIIQIFRMRAAEKRRKQRIMQRKQDHLKGTRSENRNKANSLQKKKKTKTKPKHSR